MDLSRLTQLETIELSFVSRTDNAGRDYLSMILSTYEKCFSPNMLLWLSKAAESLKTTAARKVLRDILLWEADPKQGISIKLEMMSRLRDGLHHYNRCEGYVRIMEHHMQGLNSLIMLTGLKLASSVFIPWMERAAAVLELGKPEYLKLRAETNPKHAKQMMAVIEQECNASLSTDLTLPCTLVRGLILSIFDVRTFEEVMKLYSPLLPT